MVVTGEFFAIKDTYPNTGPVYKVGAVIGSEQFISGGNWDIDLICQQDGIIAKFTHESFEALKFNQAQSCSRIYNRIIRHRLMQLIYERKNNKEYFTDHMKPEIDKLLLHDNDFFIDFEVQTKEEINNLFRSLT